MKTKICIKCKKEKKIYDFHVRNDSTDGFRNECKKCRSFSAQKRHYRNKEKNNIASRLYYIKNRESQLEKRKEYYLKNRNKILKNIKKYHKLNRIARNKKNNEYHQKVKWENPKIRLRLNTSSLICERLKTRLVNKNKKATFDFLPYTIDELYYHLESKFESWMNWDNYGHGRGKWTIDHIKPDSSFDYKSVDDKEFQECWALDNLQPLEFIANVKKGNNII